jgi:hypothetical protein
MKLQMNGVLKGVAAASVLGLAAAGFAGAQAAEKPLSEIVAGLEGMGYTAFDEIERERTAWEVEATAPNGTRVDLTVDPADGRVLSEKADK